MIKKTILVTFMLATMPVIAGDHEFLTTNPYDVDVPYNPQVIIGVEKPRVAVEAKVAQRTWVGIPTELQAPIEARPAPKAEVGAPLDRSSFYEDESMDSQADLFNAGDDSDLFNAGADSDLFNAGDDSDLYDTGDDSDLFNAGGDSDLFNAADDSDLFNAADDSDLFNAADDSDLYDKEDANYPASIDATTNIPSASFDEPVSVVKQPQINSYQRKLKGTPTEFLMITNPSSRVFVSSSDGKVYFHAKKGTLEENLIELLSVTDTVFPLMYEVSNQHVNSTDVWIYGDTVLDVLNSLLTNYVDPHPIRASTYANRIVEIYYDKKNRQR